MLHPNLPSDYTPLPLECQANGGFSSRLRVLASAAIWALTRLNTTVQVLWMAELNVFGAPASILFDMDAIPDWFRIHDAPFLPHTGWLSARLILTQDDMESYTETMGNRPLRIVASAQFAQSMLITECIRMFKPAASIEGAVNAALGQVIGRTVIGVHYRKGTEKQSPATSFWAAMTVALDSNTLFYLASDDPSFVEAAQLRFPGQTTVGFKQAKEPNNPEGNEQAAIDFYALARTTRILGSAGSGFGELSANYGGIEYIPILA